MNPQNIDLRVEWLTPKAVVIRISGWFRSHDSVYFQTEMHKLLTSNPEYVIFECSGLDDITKAGVAGLVDTVKRVSRPAKGTVILTNLQQRVRERISRLGFDKFLVILKEVEEGVKFVIEVELVELQECLEWLHFCETFGNAARYIDGRREMWDAFQSAIVLQTMRLVPEYRAFAEWYQTSRPETHTLETSEWIPQVSRLSDLLAERVNEGLIARAKVDTVVPLKPDAST